MDEVSPLTVLLTAMRRRWEANDEPGAVALARVAAPYLHGRVSPARAFGELAEVPDEELGAWSGAGGAAAP